MKWQVIGVATILIMSMACTNPYNATAQTTNTNPSTQQTTTNMKSYISIFEIPTNDFSRARKFYQSILGIEIQEMEMQGMQMGLFPSEGQSSSGVLIKGEGYAPSADGVVIYLNGGDDLQIILDKVEPSGGTIIVPKTLIDEENGHFAMFLDTEGNRLGLHSVN